MSSKKVKSLYFPLHLHTTFSVADGVPTCDEWALKLAEEGFEGGGIADHGTLSAIWKFQKALTEMNLKAVLGIEIYVVDEYTKSKDRGHLTIFFKSKRGFEKFLEYYRKSYVEGFYHKPRFLLEDVFQLEDIVLLSGCIYSPFLNDELLIKRAIERFGEDFYLELSLEPSAQRQKLNQFLVSIREKYNVKFCFTLDAHFIDKEDSEVRRVLRLASLGKTIQEDKEDENKFIRLLTEKDIRLLIDKVYPYLKDYIKEAFDVSFEVAEKCKFNYKKIDFSELLKEHSFDEFIKLFENKDIIDEKVFKKEIEVYKQRRFYDYLLTILEIVKIAKQKNILIYPRGSVCSSLVAHILDIVPFNPLQFGLLFERFLTPEREDPPDVDLDIEHSRRDELIDELKKKFKLIGLITFGTYKEKQAIRDVCRVYSISDVRDLPQSLLNLAKKLENRVRFRGRHGVGFLLFDKDNEKYKKIIPIEKVSDEEVCCFDASDLSDIGIAKFDILPSYNLTIVKEVLQRAGRQVENPIKAVLKHLDKSEVYREIYQKKKVAGIHMFDSDMARNLLDKFKIEKFDDIVNFLAFDRPGPLKNYAIERMTKKYPDFIMKYVKETQGLFLFQEQIMLVLKELGYSDKEIHRCRKAISKKRKAELEKFESDIKKKLMSKGVDKETAEVIWNDILEFSGYAFNKAHAVSYALLSYLMAVLKYRFKELFYERVLRYVLSMGMTAENKLVSLIKEILSEGYKIKLPSFDEPVGYVKFNGSYYRLGIGFVKGVGDKLAERLEKYDGVKFSSFDEFVRKLKFTSQAIKSLGQAGFFDSVYPRKFVYENYKELAKGTSLFVSSEIEDWDEKEKKTRLLEVMPFLKLVYNK